MKLCCGNCQFWASRGEEGDCEASDQHEARTRVVIYRRDAGSSRIYSEMDPSKEFRANLITHRDHYCSDWQKYRKIISADV
jgi:NADH:ubiquinone oxidoreductase subunit